MKVFRRHVRLAVAFIILLTASTFAAAEERRMPNSIDTSSEIKQTILEMEREIMAAIKDKNTAALNRILADDFVYRTPGGVDATKAEFIKNIASLPIKILSISGEDLKVNVYGEVAVLTGVQQAKAQDSEGKEGISKVAFTDVFVKRQGRWRMVLAYGVELPSAD